MQTRLLVAAATILMGSGFAAGFVVRPAVRPATPAPAAPDTPDDAPARAGARTTQRPQAGALLAAAATWSALPKLQLPAAPAQAQSSARQRVRLEELPEPVQKVLAQLTLGRKVQNPHYEARERDGQRLYKAEFDVDGLEQEFAIDEQGQVLFSEFDLALGDVPAVVAKGIEAALPGAILLEAERDEQRDGPPFFEIDVTHQGRKMELHVAEDGRILRQRVR